jgi:hypothetical protein
VKVDGDCRFLHLNRGFPGECVYDLSAVRQRGLDVAIAEINKEIDRAHQARISGETELPGRGDKLLDQDSGGTEGRAFNVMK